MPTILNQDALDDALEADGTESFAGGQHSEGRRALLESNQGHRLRNLIIADRTGRLRTRRGSDQIGTDATPAPNEDGFAYFDTPALKRLVRVFNGAVQTHDDTPGAAWVTVAGWAPTAGLPTAIVQGIADGSQVLLFSNGTDDVRSWDGTSFTVEAAIPKGTTLLWSGSRLLVAGVAATPDTIYFSDVLDAHVGYLISQQLRVGAGDGDPIVSLRKWHEQIVAVFKRNSAHYVNADPAVTVANMVVDRVNGALGIVSERAVAEVGRDLWYLTPEKTIGALGRYLESGAEAGAVVSAGVQAELDLLTPVTAAAAITHGQRFLLAVRGPGGTQVLSYNIDRAAWEGAWEGWDPVAWAESFFGGAKRLNWFDGSGLVRRWRTANAETAEQVDDYRDAYFGTYNDIRSTLETRNHTWGLPRNPKRPFSGEVELGDSTAPSLRIWLIRDEIVDTSSTAYDPARQRIGLNLLHEEPVRELGLRVESFQGKLTIAAVRLEAFVDTVQVLDLPTIGDAFTSPDNLAPWTDDTGAEITTDTGETIHFALFP